jgi:pimeloyl-ACP methyl ester carboxylesterase
VVPAGSLAEIAAANDQAERVAIPNAGHMIPFENLSRFVTEVVGFVERSAKPGQE